MGNLWEFSRNWQKKNGWAWDGLKFLVVMTLKSSIRQEWRSGGFPLNFCGCDLQLMTFFQSSVPTLWHSSQWGKRTGPVPIEFYLFWRCLHNPITFLFWLKKKHVILKSGTPAVRTRVLTVGYPRISWFPILEYQNHPESFETMGIMVESWWKPLI